MTHTHTRSAELRCTSDRLMPRPLPTQHNTNTNIHAPSEIRNRDPSNRATADLRLGRHGNRDRLNLKLVSYTALQTGSAFHYILCFS